MKISNILANKGDFVATVTPATAVTDLLATLAEHRIGAVVVCEPAKHVVGIVSERDIARALQKRGAGCLTEPVSALMTETVATCTPSSTTAELMGLMTERRIRHIPVIDEDELIGIVSIGDVVKARLDELELERDALQAYITT